jgi:hypothetical protein
MTVLMSWLLAAGLAAVLIGGWVLRVMLQASRRRTRPGRSVELRRPQPQIVEPPESERAGLDAAFGDAQLMLVDRYREHRERIGF